jgi:hypothetical protein
MDATADNFALGNSTVDDMGNVHSILTKEQAEALDIIKWCMAVPKIQADERRFNYYVSRWNVPYKIFCAKARGTFDETVANCPPIDPAWLRLVPAALEELKRYQENIHAPLTPFETAQSLSRINEKRKRKQPKPPLKNLMRQSS